MLKINRNMFVKMKKILKKWIEKFKRLNLKKYFVKFHFSWVYLLYGLPLFVILYYPLGAYLMEDIDANPNIEIKKASSEQSDVVNAMAYIIDKETNRHFWTPNMPVIFPAYILDNMPEFQMGEIKAVANISSVFAKVMKGHLNEEAIELGTAAQYLEYSPTIWFFAENSDKIFAPSSSTQYNKAKRELLNFNQKLTDRKAVFTYNAKDLDIIMNSVHRDLYKSSEKIKEYILENSDNFIDNKADNLFYYTKGKLYAYYIMLKAVGEDYKTIIVDSGKYTEWTAMLKSLESGALIQPVFVRNGGLDSSFSPNHLAYINMYLLMADNYIQGFDFLQAEEL